HQILARAELAEVAAGVGQLWHDQRGDDLVRPAHRVAVAVDERRDWYVTHARPARELDRRVEDQKIWNAIASRGRGADVADQRRAILHLLTADLARGALVSGKLRRKGRAGEVGPGHEAAEAISVCGLLDAIETRDAGDVEQVLVRRIAPREPAGARRVNVGRACHDHHVVRG